MQPPGAGVNRAEAVALVAAAMAASAAASWFLCTWWHRIRSTEARRAAPPQVERTQVLGHAVDIRPLYNGHSPRNGGPVT